MMSTLEQIKDSNVAASFKKMAKEGKIKRADALKVRYSDLKVVPGFNTRIDGPRLQEHIQGIFEFIINGGEVPALEVQPSPDGDGVVIVDGHCRHAAMGKAIKAGHNIEWVQVVPFNGDAAAASARIVSSNSGLQLTQLELALVYRRLKTEFDMKPDAIALKVGKTRQHVDQLLILADAPPEVHQLVADGSVAATEAMKITRTHGQQAGEILMKQVNDAKAAGKDRATAATLKPWTPPAKVTEPIVNAVSGLVATFTPYEHELLNVVRNDPAQEAKVLISARQLLALVDNHAAMIEARAKAERRAAKAAAKAAQGNQTPAAQADETSATEGAGTAVASGEANNENLAPAAA